MTDRALPGEATLVANWEALTTRSPRARIAHTSDAVVALFPEWAPLNNAILVGTTDHSFEAGRAATVTRLAAAYADEGVDSWAVWVGSPSDNFSDPDRISLPTLVRDTTTLVMHATIDDRHGPHDDVVVGCSLDDALTAGDDPLPADALHRVGDGSADTLAAPGLRSWVALDGDLAVAGLWSFVHEDDCGLYGISTVPAWRRRGLARRLIEHALHDAHRRGARTASLQSTPMAVSLYRSLGFVAAGRYEEWIPTPAGE